MYVFKASNENIYAVKKVARQLNYEMDQPHSNGYLYVLNSIFAKNKDLKLRYKNIFDAQTRLAYAYAHETVKVYFESRGIHKDDTELALKLLEAFFDPWKVAVKLYILCKHENIQDYITWYKEHYTREQLVQEYNSTDVDLGNILAY